MNNTMKLVERLTAIFPPHGTLAFEAADAIETLTQRVKCLEEALGARDKVIGVMADCIDLAFSTGFGVDTPPDWHKSVRKVQRARTTLANQGGEK